MPILFPTTPATNTVAPFGPSVPGVAYTYRNAAWYNQTGRANRENKFQNPSFQISQINTPNADAINVQGLVVADGYYAYYNSNTGSYRGQRVPSVTPRGGQYRVRISVTVADASMSSGEWLAIESNIEGVRMQDALFGTAQARGLVARFGFKGPTGTYNFNIRNGATTRSFIAPFTVSAANANKDIEVVIPVPPCIDGVWNYDNTVWCYLEWTFCNGNTTTAGNINKWVTGNFVSASGISNGFNTVGNTFELFDMGLYVDPNFTGLPPEFEVPNYVDQLIACKRYIQKIYGLRGIITASTHAERCGAPLQVPMRVPPALSVIGTPHLYDAYNTPVITAINGNYCSNTVVNCGLDFGAISTSGGRAACMYYEVDTSYIRAVSWL